jgi:DNA polymerase III psi subunit
VLEICAKIFTKMLMMNTIAFQHLFSEENIYLIKDEFKASSSETSTPKVTEVMTPNFYQPKTKVIILLNTLQPAHTELLTKILTAVQLNLESVDLIELDKMDNIDLSQVFSQKSVKQVISFGIDLAKVQINFPLNNYQISENQGIKFIMSDTLSDLENDIPKKKALWTALKAMF